MTAYPYERGVLQPAQHILSYDATLDPPLLTLVRAFLLVAVKANRIHDAKYLDACKLVYVHDGAFAFEEPK